MELWTRIVVCYTPFIFCHFAKANTLPRTRPTSDKFVDWRKLVKIYYTIYKNTWLSPEFIIFIYLFLDYFMTLPVWRLRQNTYYIFSSIGKINGLQFHLKYNLKLDNVIKDMELLCVASMWVCCTSHRDKPRFGLMRGAASCLPSSSRSQMVSLQTRRIIPSLRSLGDCDVRGKKNPFFHWWSFEPWILCTNSLRTLW